MNIKDLINYDISNTTFWFNTERIKITRMYEIFNLCEIEFIDIERKDIVDTISISIFPNYEVAISIHRL